MKHLISATLSMEAGQVWESWPVHSETEIGRSATLSMLLVDSGSLVLRQKANSAMIGHLRGNIATHRRRLIDFMRSLARTKKAFMRSTWIQPRMWDTESLLLSSD